MAKVKAKPKVKTKTKVSAKAKPKPKATAKPKSKATAKPKTKATAKPKTKVTAKPKTKATPPETSSLPVSWGDPPKGSPRFRRAVILGELQTYVSKVFAKHKQLRSAMFAVAQYWADEADDAVHASVVFSERETPFWPHRCSWESERGDEPTIASPDRCSSCGKYGWLPFDSNGGGIVAFQSCCLEGASQESTAGDAYLPYAVVRRGDGARVELELIGGPVRAWLEDVTTTNDPEGLDYGLEESEKASDEELAAAREPRTSRPIDPATRSLVELVHAKPHDDDARAVLADHLQQQDDPLGEYITLALAKLDGARRQSADARMRELEAAHVPTWLGPLFDVTPPEHIQLARGFVRSLAVHLADDAVAARVASAPEWGTVEELWFLPQSVQRLSPAMRSLRSVGPLDAAGIASLAKLAAKLPIERLHVMATEEGVLKKLAGLDLPRLRHLGISGADASEQERLNPFTGQVMHFVESTPGSARITPTMLKPLMAASFWKNLDEVTLATIEPTVITTWLKRSVDQRPRTLAFSAPSPSGAPAGFRLRATGDAVVVDVPAVGSRTTFAQLAELIAALPDTIKKVAFASTRWFEPSPADLATLSAATHRKVARA